MNNNDQPASHLTSHQPLDGKGTTDYSMLNMDQLIRVKRPLDSRFTNTGNDSGVSDEQNDNTSYFRSVVCSSRALYASYSCVVVSAKNQAVLAQNWNFANQRHCDTWYGNSKVWTKQQ